MFKCICEHCKVESVVFDHVYECVTCQQVKDISQYFQILAHVDYKNILMAEAILIQNYTSNFNIQVFYTGIGRFLKYLNKTV